MTAPMAVLWILVTLAFGAAMYRVGWRARGIAGEIAGEASSDGKGAA